MSGIGRSIALAASAVTLALSLNMISPQPASAQGLFEALFGGLGGDARPRRAVRPYDDRGPVSAYAPYRQDERFPHPGLSLRRDDDPDRPRAAVGGGSGNTHCVRLCDGRYFPVPRSANGARLDPEKICSALCPKADTKVFHGANMSYARAADGERYADLDNAFAFRDKTVPDCSCTGQGPGGLAQIDIESDPTLRAGDVVVTAEGAQVFTGASQPPHTSASFTPVEDYRRLNASMRQQLSDLQVNQSATPVLPPQTIAAGDATKSAPRRSRRAVQAPRGTVTMDTLSGPRGSPWPFR